MAVDDQDFLAAIARHLVGRFLEQRQLQAAAVGHGAGFMLGLGNLSKIVFGEYDRVFLIGRVQRSVAHVEEIGAERKMRAVFLENAERKQADSLGAMNTFPEVRSREFFPMDRKFRLRGGGLSVEKY